MAEDTQQSPEAEAEEQFRELKNQIAERLDPNVRLLVMATNPTQDQFNKQFPPLLDSLAAEAARVSVRYYEGRRSAHRNRSSKMDGANS